jgi:predicted acetyltransferase
MWEICFPGDENGFSDHYFRSRTEPMNVLALFENGVMKASLHILRQTERFFDTEKEIGFIAGVATLPEYRNMGLANQLLRASFGFMKNAGLSAAMLQPFSHDFYRKTGFETFALRNEYVLKKNESTVTDKISFSAPSPRRMLDIYDRFMAPYSGYKKRSERDFELLLDEAASTEGIVLQTENAYAFCDAEGNEAAVTELAGVNLKPLLTSLFDREFDSVRFPLPEDQLIPGLYSVLEPFNMLRIIDSEKFLKGLPAKDGEHFFEISDPDIAENCGLYKISSDCGIVRKTEKVNSLSDAPLVDIASLMRRVCGLKVTGDRLNGIFSQEAVNYAFERY